MLVFGRLHAGARGGSGRVRQVQAGPGSHPRRRYRGSSPASPGCPGAITGCPTRSTPVNATAGKCERSRAASDGPRHGHLQSRSKHEITETQAWASLHHASSGHLCSGGPAFRMNIKWQHSKKQPVNTQGPGLCELKMPPQRDSMLPLKKCHLQSTSGCQTKALP